MAEPSAYPAPAPDCPKHMIFGPCGGVRPDGGCEMAAQPCAFAEPVLPSTPVRGRAPRSVPRVLVDLSVPPYDRSALVRAAQLLAPAADAVLVGEHHNRPDFPPTLLAQVLLGAGANPWLTLACRDRNRIVLEQELRGLQLVGVDTALCVTGDGRGPDVRPDVTQVFDLDGPRLTMLAAQLGMSAAVAETPNAPPRSLRALRLVGKQRCGASVAVLNHVARPADVAAFVAAARGEGLTIPVIAAVAVFTDEASVAALRGLPGLELDADVVGSVLSSGDPVAAGVAAAVHEARTLLSIDGVAGVNISGLASARGWEYAAQVKTDVGLGIRDAA
jgi:methylenetetrahydrofolate reductase (NADPH)